VLVVGLGNPGPEYATSRHNVGFLVVDELAARRAAGPFRKKFHGEVGEARWGSLFLTLLKPMTYMNESGRSVRAAVAFYKVDLDQVVVVHDELDLPFGEIRLKSGGGDAGNRGVRSVAAELGSPDFLRVRLGIGKPPPGFRGGGRDFVLQGFAPAERAELRAVVARAADAVEAIAVRGLAAAMNEIHRSKPPG
jgi:PTH1 family peptidyl-tRNA hydrolase